MSTKPEVNAEDAGEWPDHDLIYVRDARRRARADWERGSGSSGSSPEGTTRTGMSTSTPVERRAQDGVQPHWLLDPEYDLIL